MSGGRSSTPKTQLRYQEQKDEDEEEEQYHYQHFPSAIDFSAADANTTNNKRYEASKIFKQSLESPPNKINDRKNSIEESLRMNQQNITNADTTLHQNLSRQSLLSQLPRQMGQEPKNYDLPLQHEKSGSIYEYTLQNQTISEQFDIEKPIIKKQENIELQQNSRRQSLLYPNTNQQDKSSQRQSLQNLMNSNTDKTNSNCNMGLSAFTKEIMNSISKIDTFSPNIISDLCQVKSQDLQLSKNVIKINDGQLKYSIEFINDGEDDDECMDSQSTHDLVKTSEKSNPKKHLGFSQASLQNVSDEDQCKMMASTNDLDQFKINTLQLQQMQKLSNQQSQQTTIDIDNSQFTHRSSQQRLSQQINNNNNTMSSGSSTQRSIEIAVALQAFNGQKEQDLSFKQGEKIIIEQRIKGSSWLYGSIGLRKGWFPSSFVSIQEHYI